MPGTPSSAIRFGALSSADVSTLDAAAGELGLATAMLMELAGWQVARLVDRLIGGPGEVLVVAGSGNNGGDALVAARHLHSWGHAVNVHVVAAADWRWASLATLLTRLRVEVVTDSTGANASTAIAAANDGSRSWVVDGLLGTGLSSPPRDAHRDVIEAINGSLLRVQSPTPSSAEAVNTPPDEKEGTAEGSRRRRRRGRRGGRRGRDGGAPGNSGPSSAPPTSGT